MDLNFPVIPPGFLGSRADLLFDLIMVSILGIAPTLVISWRLARQGAYTAHKRVQIVLTLVLTGVLVLFELNLKSKGGFYALTRDSRFADTWVLPTCLFVHLLFAVSTAVIWISLLSVSIVRFSTPPLPNDFSRAHRFWGRLAIIDLLLTAVTAVGLYVIGFIY